jgi:hypothetical protein
MADRYVWSAAAGAGTGADFTNAFTTMAAGLSGAAATDRILVASDHNEAPSAAITLTFPGTPGLQVISVNRGSGVATAGASIAIGGATTQPLVLNGFAYIYGVTFLSTTASTSSGAITVGGASTDHNFTLDTCTLKIRGGNAAMTINLGQGASATADELFIRMDNCTVSLNAATQAVRPRNAKIEINNLILDGASTVPTSLFNTSGGMGSILTVSASDLSTWAYTNLVNIPSGVGASRYSFHQCKLPAGITIANIATAAKSWELWLLDCASGDTNGVFGYYDHLGSVVNDTATYLNGGGNASWKITTTAECSFGSPFVTPWIDWYNTTLSSIGPFKLECLRNNGTAAAYNNNQVWAEFHVKTVGASPIGTEYHDGLTVPTATATAQTAGTGTGNWTIASSSSPYSFRCDSISALTPAEVGYIRSRLHVAVPSIAGTLFVHPAPTV